MFPVILRTVFPILLLIGAGFSSMHFGLLKRGDERVLGRYIFYFALPALFIVNISEIEFALETLRFVAAAMIPHIIALSIIFVIYLIFRFSRNLLYLIIVCTVFGSHSFFGLPFVIFAYDSEPQAEKLAVLSSSFIAISAVLITITTLERYKVGEASLWNSIKGVLKRLSRNPLIISITFGILLGGFGLRIPAPVYRPLHMLGQSAAVVAIFMLGMSLYGRNYSNFFLAFKLSLIRMAFLPFTAFLMTRLFALNELETTIATIMHATPMALATMVFSEEYDFYQGVIPALMLISSIGAAVYLNIWLFFLGFP